jgi:hypothetical protein
MKISSVTEFRIASADGSWVQKTVNNILILEQGLCIYNINLQVEKVKEFLNKLIVPVKL